MPIEYGEQYKSSNVNSTNTTASSSLLNMTIDTHLICNNPYGQTVSHLIKNSESNTSQTIDAGLNSITRGITFKYTACQNAMNGTDSRQFRVIAKPRFGTH